MSRLFLPIIVAMITASSEPPNFRTRLANGILESLADVTEKEGGTAGGFGPHDLLESALAACMNITVRMYAEHHSIPLRAVTTKVGIMHPLPDETLFYYEVALEGELTTDQKEKLMHAAHACPVRKTLSQKIRFESAS